MKIQELKWIESPSLGGRRKLVALDCFGNQFRRIDLPAHDVDALRSAAQADYEARIKSALVEVPAVKGEPEPVAWPANLNPRTLDLVQRFALALAKKLRLAEEKYGHTDGWSRDDWEAECRDHLYQHLEKGDPRDVAAYCAFMWHHGWITYRPVLPAPPADAGMREALERARGAIVLAISFLTRDCGTDRINKTAESLATILVKEDRAALAALTAPGATTKSDGLCQCSWSCVEASNCRRKAALKSDVEALAATTAERPGAVTSEPEPSTSDSARDDVPLGYERVTDCTTLPGDKFRYALDNNGVTGKVIGHFRPIKPGPSDPSSTRSEVTVEIKHLISSARAFLAHFNPCVLAEDKSQQWQSLEHQCNRVERALLDQFEIRRK